MQIGDSHRRADDCIRHGTGVRLNERLGDQARVRSLGRPRSHASQQTRASAGAPDHSLVAIAITVSAAGRGRKESSGRRSTDVHRGACACSPDWRQTPRAAAKTRRQHYDVVATSEDLRECQDYDDQRHRHRDVA